MPAVIRFARVALLAAMTGCASRESGTVEMQVEQAEAVEHQQLEQTKRIAAGMNALLSDFGEFDGRFRTVAERFRVATLIAERASAEYDMAAREFADAEKNYRWIVYAVVVAAASDAVMQGAEKICASIQSTRSYRRINGIDDGSVCIDHAFPHALGGINSPLNYQLLDCGLNSSYGAALSAKFADYPIAILQGMAVSALARLRCGSTAAAWSR